MDRSFLFFETPNFSGSACFVGGGAYIDLDGMDPPATPARRRRGGSSTRNHLPGLSFRLASPWAQLLALVEQEIINEKVKENKSKHKMKRRKTERKSFVVRMCVSFFSFCYFCTIVCGKLKRKSRKMIIWWRIVGGWFCADAGCFVKVMNGIDLTSRNKEIK